MPNYYVFIRRLCTCHDCAYQRWKEPGYTKIGAGNVLDLAARSGRYNFSKKPIWCSRKIKSTKFCLRLWHVCTCCQCFCRSFFHVRLKTSDLRVWCAFTVLHFVSIADTGMQPKYVNWLMSANETPWNFWWRSQLWILHVRACWLN